MVSRLLWTLAMVLIGAFACFGLLEYNFLSSSLLGEVDRSLAQRAAFLAEQWRESHLEKGDIEHLIPDRHPLNEISKVYVELVDKQGRILLRSDNLGQDSLPLTPLGDKASFFEGRSPNGERLRIYQEPLGTEIWLRLAEPLQLVDHALRRAALGIMSAVALTLLVTLWVTRKVMQKGFSPLERIALTSKKIIQTGDVSIRLKPESTDSEFVDVITAMNALLARVEEVLEAQKRLLSDTSHELRNPLTVLRTDLDLLGKQDIDQDVRVEVVQESQREVDRMVRLVEDLLLISWAEARPSILHQDFEMVPLVELAVERIRRISGQRKLNLAVEPCRVSADPDRVLQIIINLLDNAVHHTDEGGCITVWTPAAEGRVLIVVQDDGEGIAQEHLGKLFERFYRVDASRSRAKGGTGLGLPLARALARAMGGDLWVTSQPGQGSSFYLALESASS